MRLILIRHGQTRGNLERRYIGCRTDEPLCEAGVAALRTRTYPPAARVFASPMRRCLETAALIYPGVEPELVEDFRECDFGAFEGMNYAELNGRADYQAWIDSGGELPFPGGESRAAFAARCARACEALMARNIRFSGSLRRGLCARRKRAVRAAVPAAALIAAKETKPGRTVP